MALLAKTSCLMALLCRAISAADCDKKGSCMGERDETSLVQVKQTLHLGKSEPTPTFKTGKGVIADQAEQSMQAMHGALQKTITNQAPDTIAMKGTDFKNRIADAASEGYMNGEGALPAVVSAAKAEVAAKAAAAEAAWQGLPRDEETGKVQWFAAAKAGVSSLMPTVGSCIDNIVQGTKTLKHYAFDNPSAQDAPVPLSPEAAAVWEEFKGLEPPEATAEMSDDAAELEVLKMMYASTWDQRRKLWKLLASLYASAGTLGYVAGHGNSDIHNRLESISNNLEFAYSSFDVAIVREPEGCQVWDSRKVKEPGVEYCSYDEDKVCGKSLGASILAFMLDVDLKLQAAMIDIEEKYRQPDGREKRDPESKAFFQWKTDQYTAYINPIKATKTAERAWAKKSLSTRLGKNYLSFTSSLAGLTKNVRWKPTSEDLENKATMMKFVMGIAGQVAKDLKQLIEEQDSKILNIGTLAVTYVFAMSNLRHPSYALPVIGPALKFCKSITSTLLFGNDLSDLAKSWRKCNNVNVVLKKMYQNFYVEGEGEEGEAQGEAEES